MGEEHMQVDPCLGVGRQQRRFKLPGRQRYLLIRAAEHVAIDVDVVELVVGADFLQLGVCVHQRLPVPEPDVVDGRPVVLKRLEGKRLFRRERFDEIFRRLKASWVRAMFCWM